MKELFNVPLKNEEINHKVNESGYQIVTDEIINESIPVKRPYTDFVPTMKIKF